MLTETATMDVGGTSELPGMTVEEGLGDRPLTQAGIAGPEFLHIHSLPSLPWAWVLSFLLSTRSFLRISPGFFQLITILKARTSF